MVNPNNQAACPYHHNYTHLAFPIPCTYLIQTALVTCQQLTLEIDAENPTEPVGSKKMQIIRKPRGSLKNFVIFLPDQPWCDYFEQFQCMSL